MWALVDQNKGRFVDCAQSPFGAPTFEMFYMKIEHFRKGFGVFHPPKTAKIAGPPRGRVRRQMRGWPTPEGHPAAKVDGIGHEGAQCMRASIATASGAPQTTLVRAHFRHTNKHSAAPPHPPKQINHGIVRILLLVTKKQYKYHKYIHKNVL